MNHLKKLKKIEGHSLYYRKVSDRFASGIPDLHIIYRGDSCFIELKAPGKRPTALQRREIDNLIKAGSLAVWFDNWGKTIHFINEFVSARDV
jgi:hypothetical protein